MTVDRTEGRAAPTEEDRWFLTDEREFLLRSLDDAEREHEAGDLSDEDYALLVRRDRAKLADVEADLSALGSAPANSTAATATATATAVGSDAAEPVAEPERRPFPLWRKIGIAVCCLLIVAGGAVLVTHYVTARQPGQSSSGGVTLSEAQEIEQQLDQALALNNSGQTKAALVLYDKVLTEDPSDPVALSYDGYLLWNLGTAAGLTTYEKNGRAEIERAIEVAPTYYEAHLFYGLILENQDHDNGAAVTQFDQYLADDPPPGGPAQAASLVAPAYQALGEALPSGFATSPSTSSTSTPTTTTTTTSAP